MSRRSLQPVERQRLHETIADRLEEMILNGDFRPGESLPTETEMCAQLQVSRTVVRDAIRVLATKGLVDIRHGVGTFVTQSGRERLAEALALSVRRGDYSPWDLYVIRRGLEMVVVEEAIDRAGDEQIEQMREALAECRALFHEDPPRSGQLHELFHQLMSRSTGNQILADLLDPITVFRIPQNLGYTGAPPGSDQDDEEYLRRHERILQAIVERDEERAKAAMTDHLRDLEGRARRATDELRRSKDGATRR